MPLGLEKLSLRGDNRKSGAYVAEKQGDLKTSNSPSGEAPPSYAAEDPINEPSSDELNAAFSNINIPDVPPAFPTPEHCLAHLKLLNAFHSLKEEMGYADGLFGLWDSKSEVLEGKDREQALARTREKRWALYVARAVERFEVWWIKVLWPREGGRRLEGKEMVETNTDFSQFPYRGRTQHWTVEMLPPIGTHLFEPLSSFTTNSHRCPYGMACIHA